MVVAALAVWAGACAEGEWLMLFAGRGWYVEAPGEEQILTGRLRRNTPPAGPAGRVSRAFVLETEDRVLPVYAPERLDVFESVLGRRVAIEGKLVDLGDEGFGLELWPGRIAIREADAGTEPGADRGS